MNIILLRMKYRLGCLTILHLRSQNRQRNLTKDKMRSSVPRHFDRPFLEIFCDQDLRFYMLYNTNHFILQILYRLSAPGPIRMTHYKLSRTSIHRGPLIWGKSPPKKKNYFMKPCKIQGHRIIYTLTIMKQNAFLHSSWEGLQSNFSYFYISRNIFRAINDLHFLTEIW